MAKTADGRVDGRTLRYQGRRLELLQAVTAYVLQHGVGDLAIRPMAEAAGVSHATLLSHFGTKENLISEVVNLLREQSIPPESELPVMRDGATDVAAALRLWWHTWTQPEYLPPLRITFEVYGRALVHPERYAQFLEHVVADWLNRFRHFLRAAGCPPEEVDDVSTALLAQMRGLQVDLLATGDAERVNRAHDWFARNVGEHQARWKLAAKR